MNTADKDALHAAITGLRGAPEVLAKMEGSPKGFYLLGFEAARHAAAEEVAKVAPQEVRMLTLEELADALRTDYGPAVMNRSEAVQHKFAAVNGLSIKEQAVKPATDKEMPK